MTNTFLSEGDRTIDQMVQSVGGEKLQQDFLQNGGIKEQMYHARINNRK
ncbi:MAG: four helix bundle suffix domain-containing protein [Candidatus Limisoma sp.]|nr:four helix bundle suffix domain-containing protein [Candidatus Limisoma sp.]